jgi:hypothetical protein
MEKFRRALGLISAALCRAVISAIAFTAIATGAANAQSADGSGGVTIRNLGTPGAIVITNRGPAVGLSRRMGVQKLVQGQWVDVTSDLALTETCGAPAGECVSLPAGGTLRPKRWTGLGCGSQCPASCRANVYFGPAKIRFVLSICESGEKVYGPPFDLPAYGASRRRH